jgi:hypothetical protein
VSNASAGHVVLAPSHDSAVSHGPVDARHMVPDGAGPAALHTGAPLEQSN